MTGEITDVTLAEFDLVVRDHYLTWYQKSGSSLDVFEGPTEVLFPAAFEAKQIGLFSGEYEGYKTYIIEERLKSAISQEVEEGLLGQ